MKIKWNIELARKEAMKYNRRNKFCIESPSAYSWIRDRQLLNEMCSHMKPVVKWDYNSVKKEALKYKGKFEFRKFSGGAYEWARRHKELDEICSHMTSGFIFWSLELSYKEALKYKTRKAFSIGNPNAYGYAVRKKILDKICTHMVFKHNKFSKKEAIEISKKYSTKQELRDQNIHLYTYLIRHKYINEATKHMSPATNGFNIHKTGFLYYIRIEKDGITVYKVGITNRTVKDRFYSEFKYITIIKLLEYEKGQEAYDLEQQILKDYSYAQYKGDNILESGNTEMFIDDVLMLDTKVA